MSQTNKVKTAFTQAWQRAQAAEKSNNIEEAIIIYSEILDINGLTKLQTRGTESRRHALELRLVSREEIALLEKIFELPAPAPEAGKN